MSDDIYLKISCPNCESSYAIDFYPDNVEGEADYCPFCGEDIPEQKDDYDEDDQEESEETGDVW